ncbi:MAG: carbohydrate kinase family protein [Rectinemataceae bacterium]
MKLLLTGSVAFDYLMKFPGSFKEHLLPESLSSISLSFLVESMIRLRGGIAPNIAYTMALLGQRPRIMATVGEDFAEYRAWLEASGVDTALMKVIPGEHTASFFATTDRESAQLASFYPGAMAQAATQSVAEAGFVPDLVVISPNDPGAMKKFAKECRDLGIPYLYDPSQQVARLNGEELARDLSGAKFLFCNEYEFELIKSKTGLAASEIQERVEYLVVTLGKEGARFCSRDQESMIATIREDSIVDPTGVGDAFRGGFLTGYAQGWDWTLCGQIGSLAAVYCLERNGPQGHAFGTAEFVKRFRDNYDDKGVLDALMTSKE